MMISLKIVRVSTGIGVAAPVPVRYLSALPYHKVKRKRMKKMGRPRKETEQLSLRLPVETIAVLDQARKEEEDLPTRPEMVRRIIADWLEAREARE